MILFKRIFPLILAALVASPAFAARQMERVDRGVVAVKTGNGVYLSWRMFGSDPKTVAFNIYRDGVKINSEPVSSSTNYIDASGTNSSKYEVKPVISGVEKVSDGSVGVWPQFYKAFPVSAPATNSLPDGSSYTYHIADGSTGDLDGDGKWDLVFLWNPSNMKDNSLKGYTGNVWMDGYTLEGKRLFRIDLGKNIRAGCHYTQFVVADFDGDGKAEIMVKTAPGTKDGSGSYLSKGAASGADHSKDYRNSSGYILSGPEWLTVFSGESGKELATVNYNPARGTVKSWGDSYGNRVDRFLATAAWLDGVKPSGVFQRGYYTRMAITAYDWDGSTLSQRWYYNSATSGQECYAQGNHNLTTGDVDGDGKDEIIEGACAVDHDGKFMYRTGLGHGDAMHLGDLTPYNDGLEVYTVHEEKTAAYGYEMHDARTGKIIWGVKTGTDNGRGIAADVDSASAGYESWSFGSGKIQNAKGIDMTASRGMINFRVYWDADIMDETLEYQRVEKLRNSKWEVVLNLENYGVHANDANKYTPCLSADILGDWREEIIMGSTAMDSIKIFTTTDFTTHKIHTLMHDPVYRAAVSHENTAYNQPPHLGFWLGVGDANIPVPDIILTGEKPQPTLSKIGDGAATQIVVAGDTIQRFAYEFKNCTGASAKGFPNGVTAIISGTSLTISGTPSDTGTYSFTVTTSGGEGDAAVVEGSITVIPAAQTVNEPAKILSLVNAAYPADGFGTYEEKNAGWIDSGYYNFNNTADSYGLWRLRSDSTSGKTTLTIRFANGGKAGRSMNLEWNEKTLGGVPFAQTGAWTTYDSVTVEIDLVKGLNILKLSSIGSDGGPNVDEFEFTVPGVIIETDTSAVFDESTNIVRVSLPRQTGFTLRQTQDELSYNAGSNTVTLALFDIKGQVMLKTNVSGQGNVNLSSLSRGRYFAMLISKGQVVSKSFVLKN